MKAGITRISVASQPLNNTSELSHACQLVDNEASEAQSDTKQSHAEDEAKQSIEYTKRYLSTILLREGKTKDQRDAYQ